MRLDAPQRQGGQQRADSRLEVVEELISLVDPRSAAYYAWKKLATGYSRARNDGVKLDPRESDRICEIDERKKV